LFHPVISRIVILALCLMSYPVFSISFAATLTFKHVLDAGLKNGFDIRIADESIRASEFAVDEAKADYYPQLSMRFGQEYVHVYDKFSSVVSVGDVVYSDSTSKYKYSLGLYSQYNLYDFGRRRLNVHYAKQQVSLSKLQTRQAHYETSVTLLDLYVKALKLQRQIEIEERTLSRRKRIFQFAEKLQGAGKYGLQEVGDAAILHAQTAARFDGLIVDFQSVLNNLSIYTREKYISSDISVADLTPSPYEGSLDAVVEEFPEAQIIQQQIERKETELAIAKRALLPSLLLRGSFGMYGSDDHSYTDSLDQMSKRDASLTLSFIMPIFDGFAASAKKKRLHYEKSRLQLEKQKIIAELDANLEKIQNSYRSLFQLKGERINQQQRINQQICNFSRLSRQQLTDQVTLAKKAIDLDQYQLETFLQEVDAAAAALQLSLIKEAGS
jgi:outer membrane protein